MIPKVIFQTFPTATLPADVSRVVAQLKRQNVSWEHVLLDDNRMFDEVKSFGFDFSRIRPEYYVAVSDICRYILMYKYGGVYLDIKSGASRELDRITKGKDLILATWAPECEVGMSKIYKGLGIPGELINWFLASAPGNPLFLKTLEYIQNNIFHYNPRIHGVGQQAVIRITGPHVFTLAAFDMGLYDTAAGYNALGLRYTTLRTMTAHRKFFKHHYTERTTPVLVDKVVYA